MSFLDETIGKAKEVFDAVEQKTVEFTKIQKLKVKAIGVDSELTKLFAKLGKLYYAELKSAEQMSEDTAAIFEEINAKISELQHLKDEITLREGGVICEECGHLNKDGSAYCGKCGAKI